MPEPTRIVTSPDKELIDALARLLEMARGTRCEDAVARVVELWANPVYMIPGRDQ